MLAVVTVVTVGFALWTGDGCGCLPSKSGADIGGKESRLVSVAVDRLLAAEEQAAWVKRNDLLVLPRYDGVMLNWWHTKLEKISILRSGLATGTCAPI